MVVANNATQWAELEPKRGFNFENYERNINLIKDKKVPTPKLHKTGTTLAGCVFEGGVVMGADTRATSGETIAEKRCFKIHRITDNIYCCGSGTSADCDQVTTMTSTKMELHKLNTGRTPRVGTACRQLAQHLFYYQGHVSAGLILGGMDPAGAHVIQIHPYGSTAKLPYTTMGSGSLAAMSVLEDGWKPGMNEEQAKKLLRDAIASGILSDGYSGSQVDLVVITKDKTDYLREYDVVCDKGVRLGKYSFKPGTTPVLSEKMTAVVVDETIETMDTA
jgi:20S proteasome subunit beta 2